MRSENPQKIREYEITDDDSDDENDKNGKLDDL